jgi:hypothetical protein
MREATINLAGPNFCREHERYVRCCQRISERVHLALEFEIDDRYIDNYPAHHLKRIYSIPSHADDVAAKLVEKLFRHPLRKPFTLHQEDTEVHKRRLGRSKFSRLLTLCLSHRYLHKKSARRVSGHENLWPVYWPRSVLLVLASITQDVVELRRPEDLIAGRTAALQTCIHGREQRRCQEIILGCGFDLPLCWAGSPPAAAAMEPDLKPVRR